MGKIRKINESIDLSIERFLKESSMEIYREVLEQDNSSPSQRRQRAIAERLLEKFKEPKSWKFYLKCAYHLSEATIWELVGLSLKPTVKCPNRYFVYLANKEMNK